MPLAYILAFFRKKAAVSQSVSQSVSQDDDPVARNA